MSISPTMRGNWRMYHHASIDSTNLEALRLATREALPWTAVVADTQTEGRGRRGGTWVDLPGRCLLLSALVYSPPGAAALLGPLMALAAAQTLQAAGARKPAIKWPNDVILNDRKVGGVLAEGPAAGLFAVGIGLNVNASSGELPTDLHTRAGFLSEDLGHESDLLSLADALLARFEQHHFELMSGEGAGLIEKLRGFDHLAGQKIRARSGDTVIEGYAVGWTDDGRLAIINSDGNEVVLDAGEVTLS